MTLTRELAQVFNAASVRPLVYLFLIFAFFYAPQLVTFQVPTDAEFSALRGAVDGGERRPHDVWIEQGRWGIYLIERFLMPQPVVPFLPLAAFGILLALAYLMILRACGTAEPGFRHYATFPVFAAFPIWLFLAQFPANLPATGLAMALSGVFLLAFRMSIHCRREELPGRHRRLIGLYVVQAATATLAIAVYQSFAALLLVGGLGLILVSVLRKASAPGGFLLDMIGLGLAVAAGLVLYSAVLRGMLLLVGADIDYITNFVRPELILAAPYQVARRTAAEILAVYGGFDGLYGITAWSFGLLPLGAVILVGLLPPAGVSPALRIALLALLGLILFLPFSFNPINGGTIHYRSLISVPLVLWLCVFICLEFGSPLVRAAMKVALAAVVAQSLYAISLFQAASTIAWQYDQRLAAAIHTRIVSVREAAGGQGLTKVDFFGSAPVPNTVYPVSRTETVGRSIFHWGDPQRAVALYRVLGYSDVQDISPQERSRLIGEFRSMESWPHSGSVRIVGDITLVKLSGKPSHLHTVHMQADPR